MKKNLKRGEKSRGKKNASAGAGKRVPKKRERKKCFRRNRKEGPKKRERGSGFDRHRYDSILAGHKPGSRGSFFGAYAASGSRGSFFGHTLLWVPAGAFLGILFFLQFFYFTLRKHFYIIIIKYFFCRSNISTADNHKSSV